MWGEATASCGIEEEGEEKTIGSGTPSIIRCFLWRDCTVISLPPLPTHGLACLLAPPPSGNLLLTKGFINYFSYCTVKGGFASCWGLLALPLSLHVQGFKFLHFAGDNWSQCHLTKPLKLKRLAGMKQLRTLVLFQKWQVRWGSLPYLTNFFVVS